MEERLRGAAVVGTVADAVVGTVAGAVVGAVMGTVVGVVAGTVVGVVTGTVVVAVAGTVVVAVTGTVVGAMAGTVVSVVAGAMAGTVGMIGRIGGSVSPGVTPGVRALDVCSSIHSFSTSCWSLSNERRAVCLSFKFKDLRLLRSKRSPSRFRESSES